MDTTSTTTSTTHVTRPLVRCSIRDKGHKRRSKSSSPYRTNTYFGFNGAAYAKPNHFHVPMTNIRFKSLRRSISLEEIFSTRRYLENGSDDKFYNMVQAKFLMKKVLSETEGEDNCSTTDSITLQEYSEVPNNTIDLTAISEESHSDNTKTSSLVSDMINVAMEKAFALLHEDDEEPEQEAYDPHQQPNSFIETITQMAYSSESTLPPTAMQGNEASITTSFHSLQLDKSPARDATVPVSKLMGREERNCRQAEFIELWGSHLDSLHAQEENVSLEYQVNGLDNTDALIAQEGSLMKKMHRISEDLDARKKLFPDTLGDDFNEQEKLLLERLEDYNLSKDENSIFYRIEQSILNKDRPVSRCRSVESTGTQTANSISTSTPNYSTFDYSSDTSAARNNKSSGGRSQDKSRIPIRSPKPRVLFEQNDNKSNKSAQKRVTGAKAKVQNVQKQMEKMANNANSKIRTNSSSIFSVYKPSAPVAKENVNIFQKKEFPSPCLWVSYAGKGATQKRVAESPITPKTAKKPNKGLTSVTLRRRAARGLTNGPVAQVAVETFAQENRVNTFREMDLETDKLRGTIDRCTNVISDIGQSVEEMKASLAEVAVAQTELTEEIKSLNKSR